jgi:NDP-sugar pyrophosphorylase family protein
MVANGCSCEDWSKVLVKQNFVPNKIRNASFSGEIKLGIFEKSVSFFGGVKKTSGIDDATLHNCIIGDNVYIGKIKNYIANYIIEEDVIIENVDIIAVEGESSFGNGTEVAVINEGGGREIPIFDHLSAHLAYILALYRHKTKVIKRLRMLISDYTNSVRSSMGRIGKGAKVMNCRTIKNIKIGEYSIIEGIYKLTNGTINSSQSDPAFFGEGVIVEDFISCSGVKITDATLVSHCFIGQGCQLGKHYSAENSVFFANCAGFHGEACSIFAGPYTVTHHKSTLLIAGLFSFSNAGSGSNQSNHMYKLGPIHQGIVERGTKTGSDSYILWPAKVGAFSVVMGRHYKNSDTSDLPFSYLIEGQNESLLFPAVNLRSVGTIRDAQKWPKRDKRKDPEKLDYLNYNLLSPFTVGKMINGSRLLKNLKEFSGEASEFYSYQSVKIRNSSLITAIELYELGIAKFLGNALLKRLEKHDFKNIEEIRERLKPDSDSGIGEWIDLAGLFAPKQLIENMLDAIEKEKINSLSEISNFFRTLHEKYYVYAWSWVIDTIQKMLGKSIDEFTIQDIMNLTESWLKSVVDLDKKLYSDAKKEFKLTAHTGYGIDGEFQIRCEDFEEVRGDFEKNTFVKAIQEHIEEKTLLGNELIEYLIKINH